MTARFMDLAFTPAVAAIQTEQGSRDSYARIQARSTGEPDRLTENERSFIATRDSFYMATVSESGWPYLQHRGGPRGFLKVVDDGTLALADYRGNRQYVSVGNARKNDRVALFFMDYPRQARLKLLGHLRVVELADDPELAKAVIDPDYDARVERLLAIDIEAYDWNCPQHITQRFTLNQVQPALDTLKQRIAELETELAENKR